MLASEHIIFISFYIMQIGWKMHKQLAPNAVGLRLEKNSKKLTLIATRRFWHLISEKSLTDNVMEARCNLH